ncbi:VanZ family protein [Vagococcus xieshaowenii]|uniref:VanZ family protein n=1 Tax=Vagococcus xieshaowenii TaxID=2562451 RepID=A0AAJ5JL33_9ENTE|nr:VanZ family protein [Vagococcus xieshaowenii]QCA28657.1 VanZ family protein [Vagococcus xieshaowenii]TFZ40536.1 VanZ family protein [Vagococcus xieshaowenii]
MGSYLEPIKMAILAFPIIAIVLSLPIFLFQYYRNGTFLRWNALVIYSFILYMITAYFLVILPLPDRDEVAKLTIPRYNIKPFQVVMEFIKHTSLDIKNPSTYLPALKESVVIQPVFNIFLTIPFGTYMRYIFKKSLKTTVLLSFCFSLFFELTQLTGLYGYYPRSYRLFDVDDLFLNTLGGIIGYYLTPLISRLFPRHDTLQNKIKTNAKKVTYVKRTVTFITDWILFSVLLSIVEMLFFKGHSSYFSGILVFILYYYIVPAYIFDGQTIAKKITWIKMVNEDGSRITRRSLMIRQALFGVNCYIIIILLGNALEATGTVPDEQLDIALYTVFIIAGYALIFILHILYNIVIKDNELAYEEFAKTTQISIK